MTCEGYISRLAFRKLSETESGVLTLVKRDFAQIVFCRSKYMFLLKGKSVQFVFTCVAQLANGSFMLLQLWREEMIKRGFKSPNQRQAI